VNFEISPGGYEIWFSDRIAEDHPGLVNLGQIDHQALLADGVLSEQLKKDIVAWWTVRVEELDQG
jgi:hypothetical protein